MRLEEQLYWHKQYSEAALEFEVTSMLKTANALEVKENAEKELLKLNGVHGIGLSRKIADGAPDAPLCISISVDKKLPLSMLDSNQIIPKEIDGIPTDVVERKRVRKPEKYLGSDGDLRSYSPLRGGISIKPSAQYDPKPGLGTLGLIVQGPEGKPCILTCKHVIPAGPVYQPNSKGRVVANCVKADPNLDCSISELVSGISWTNWITEIGAVQGAYDIEPEDCPYYVKKRGYRTGYSDGRVTMAYYSGIDELGGTYKNFLWFEGVCDYGDSGAVLVDDCNRVVGMLYDKVGTNEAVAISITAMKLALNFNVYSDSMPRLYAIHEGKGDKPNHGDGWLWGTSTDSSMDYFATDVPWPPGVERYGTFDAPYLVSHRSFMQETYDPNMVIDMLYCIHADRENNGNIWVGRYDGRSWYIDSKWNPYTTSSPPTAVVYKGQLHVFQTRQDSIHPDRQWLASFVFDGYKSSPSQLIPPGAKDTYGTYLAPAAATYKGKLYVVHMEQGGTGKLKCTTFDGKTWSPDNFITTQNGSFIVCSQRPALATYDGKLYLVHDSPGDSGWLTYNTYDGKTWTDNATMNHLSQVGSSGAINLIVHNRALICMREGRGNDQQIRYCSTLDGNIWVDHILLQPNDTYIGCHSAPGIAHFPVTDVQDKE